MGCLVWPSSPNSEENISKTPTNGTRALTKSPDEHIKAKLIKNQKKPPRFMKMESVESKTEKTQKNMICEEEYPNEALPEQHAHLQPPQPQIPHQQIPVAIPYAPQYTVQYPAPYPVAGYPMPPVQESVPVEPAPIATVSYSEHPPHYMEPPYTIPYMVYTHPQYYYPN